LINEAQSQRFEVRSIDANAESARRSAKVQRAGAYPVVSAFADGIVANPNQRIFPQTDTFTPTWDVGARITWSPNDIPTALAGAADYESRAAGLIAQKQVLRDGIAIEVTQAFQAVQEADFALGSTDKQLASAREAVRARLSLLNARIDARTARVRLEHSLGRDSRLVQLNP
jgi:outer membrane protein TolC